MVSMDMPWSHTAEQRRPHTKENTQNDSTYIRFKSRRNQTVLFWNTYINGKAESKSKKMIPTKVMQLFISDKKGSVVMVKGFLGNLWGAASRQSKLWDRTFQEEGTANGKACGQEGAGTQGA